MSGTGSSAWFFPNLQQGKNVEPASNELIVSSSDSISLSPADK